MTVSFTPYLRSALLQHSFGGVAYQQPVNLYLGLFLTMPDNAGLGAIEPAAPSYARLSIPNNGTVLNYSNNAIRNLADINYTVPQENWGTLIGAGLFDLPLGGRLLCSEGFPTSIIAWDGADIYFPAGQLVIGLT